MGSKLVTNAGSGSWTCPSGVSSVLAQVWGGGGGGGGNTDTNSDGGGGGGGGAYARKTIAVVANTSYNYVVGSAGSGSLGATVGLNGSGSWFNTPATVYAQFGGGGGVGPGGAGGPGGLRGHATASIGDQCYSGGRGGNGRTSATGRGGSGGGSGGTASDGNSGADNQGSPVETAAVAGGGPGGAGATATSGPGAAPSVGPGGGGGGCSEDVIQPGGPGWGGQLQLTWTDPSVNVLLLWFGTELEAAG